MVSTVGRKAGGMTTLFVSLRSFGSYDLTTSKLSSNLACLKNLLTAELVEFLRGESPVLIMWITFCVSSSCSCMACQTAFEPMGIVPGLDIQSPIALAVAAVTQGSVSLKIRLVTDSGGTEMVISWMFDGILSRKRSMAQSEARQVLSALLQASLSVCCPSLAEEW
jgi:hypothetical protein